MSVRHTIDKFLSLKRFVLVGASTDEKHLSRMIMRDLTARGYQIIPVNPKAHEIEGQTAYSKIEDIADCPKALLLMIPAEKTLDICKQAAAISAQIVWFYRYAGNGPAAAEAIDFCKSNGIDVIRGYCPYMFIPDAGFIHSLHVFFLKLAGKFPK